MSEKLVLTTLPRKTQHRRVRQAPGGPSRTKQSFKKETDVNVILAGLEKTGVIKHINHREPGYGYAPAMDLQQAIHKVASANQNFMALPSEIRNRFANDPVAFADFVQDPDNFDEVAELGLLSPEYYAEQREAEAAPARAPAEPPPYP